MGDASRGPGFHSPPSLALRTSVLPFVSRVSIYLGFPVSISSQKMLLLACLPSSEHHCQRQRFLGRAPRPTPVTQEHPCHPFYWLDLLLRTSESPASQGLNGLVPRMQCGGLVHSTDFPNASGQDSPVPYILCLGSSWQNVVGIQLPVKGYFSLEQRVSDFWS